MSDSILDHLDVHATEDSVSVGIKVGNVHTPEPSSPDFGIGEAVKEWEEAVDITDAVKGLIPTEAPKAFIECIVCHARGRAPRPILAFCPACAPTVKVPHFPLSPMAAVGEFVPGDYCLRNYEEKVDERFEIV